MKMCKRIDLKVSDLKRELEERDEEISGKKSVLQERLRKALLAAGENPDDHLFPVSFENRELLTNMQEKFTETFKNIKTIEDRVIVNMKEKFAEIEEKLAVNCRSVDEKLQENIKMLEEKLDDKIGDKTRVIEELNGRIKKLEERFHSGASDLNNEDLGDLARIHDSQLEVRNIVSSGTIQGRSDLPIFDGKTPLDDYLTLLETTAVVYG